MRCCLGSKEFLSSALLYGLCYQKGKSHSTLLIGKILHVGILRHAKQVIVSLGVQGCKQLQQHTWKRRTSG